MNYTLKQLKLVNWHKHTAQTPDIVYLIGVEGTPPYHTSELLLPASHA